MFSYVFSGRLDFWWLKRAECGQKKMFPVVWCFKAYYLDICIVFFWFFSVLIFRNHRCSCWCFYYTACPCKFVVFSSCSAKYARQRAIKHVAATHAGIVWHEHQLCWSLYTKTWNYGHYSSTFDVVQDSTSYSSLVFYDMCFLLKKKFSQKKHLPHLEKTHIFVGPFRLGTSNGGVGDFTRSEGWGGATLQFMGHSADAYHQLGTTTFFEDARGEEVVSYVCSAFFFFPEKWDGWVDFWRSSKKCALFVFGWFLSCRKKGG